MPKDPSDTYVPDVNIDDSKKWILKLIEIEERESRGQYSKPGDTSMVFKWNLYDLDSGVAVIDNATDELFTLWQFVKPTTFAFNPKTGRIGESRQVAQALVGRDLTDEEIRAMNAAGWAEEDNPLPLIGKTVLADLEWYTNTAGYQRLRVLRQKPYTKPVKKKVAPASRRLDDDDEDEKAAS